MIAEIVRALIGGAAVQARNWAAGAAVLCLAGVLFVVAAGFGTAAAYSAMLPEFGAAGAAAILALVYVGLALTCLAFNAMARRRRVARQIAASKARAAAMPAMSPEMLLLAAAAGAIFSFGAPKSRR